MAKASLYQLCHDVPNVPNILDTLDMVADSTLEENETRFGESIIRMRKFNEEFEFQAEYQIKNMGGDFYQCDCPAVIDNCRHVKMLEPLLHMNPKPGENIFLRFDGKNYSWVQGPQ